MLEIPPVWQVQIRYRKGVIYKTWRDRLRYNNCYWYYTLIEKAWPTHQSHTWKKIFHVKAFPLESFKQFVFSYNDWCSLATHFKGIFRYFEDSYFNENKKTIDLRLTWYLWIWFCSTYDVQSNTLSKISLCNKKN